MCGSSADSDNDVWLGYQVGVTLVRRTSQGILFIKAS